MTKTKTEGAQVPKKVKKEKPIGVVTHFYDHIKVAIVKFNKKIDVGMALHFKGATTDLKEKITSMQFDHKPISSAEKGQEVGIEVKSKVREGDEVYAA